MNYNMKLKEQKCLTLAVVKNGQLAPMLKDIIEAYTEIRRMKFSLKQFGLMAVVNTVMHDYTTNDGTRMYSVLLDIYIK